MGSACGSAVGWFCGPGIQNRDLGGNRYLGVNIEMVAEVMLCVRLSRSQA